MKIEVMYIDDCPNHHVAEERVREALEELGLYADVVRIHIKDDATAKKKRFPGSPTIRINGEDVVPGGDGEAYSMCCRIYQTRTGLAGAPDKDTIRMALQRSTA